VDRIAVSFGSFLYGGTMVIKQPLMMARQIVLPLRERVLQQYLAKCSGGVPEIQEHLAGCLVPLESIVGRDTYDCWLQELTSWHDPKKNSAIDSFFRSASVDGIIGVVGMARLWPFQVICSSFFSNEIYRKFCIPSFVIPWEVEIIDKNLKCIVQLDRDHDVTKCLAKMACPDLDALSWEEIVALRDSQEFGRSLDKLPEFGNEALIGGSGCMPFAVWNKHVDCVVHAKPNIPKSSLKPIFCEFPFNPFRAPWSGDSPSQVAEPDSGARQYGYLLLTFGWRDDTTNGEVSLMTQ
jgi:hypothetical protein